MIEKLLNCIQKYSFGLVQNKEQAQIAVLILSSGIILLSIGLFSMSGPSVQEPDYSGVNAALEKYSK